MMWSFLFLQMVYAQTPNLQPIESNASKEQTPSFQKEFAIIGGGLLSYVAAHQIPISTSDARSAPTGLDAWVEPQWNPNWEWSSDFLGHPYAHYGFNLPVLTTASMMVWGSQTQQDWRTALPIVESIALTAAVTEVLKRTVQRPRPYTSVAFEEKYPSVYASDEMITLREDIDTFKSFPSGHTSNAAATYFTSAALIAQQSDNRTIDILAYSSAALLTGLTGFSRVYYGKHHISDTLVGAAIGTSIGLSIAHFHTRF